MDRKMRERSHTKRLAEAEHGVNIKPGPKVKNRHKKMSHHRDSPLNGLSIELQVMPTGVNSVQSSFTFRV